MASQNLLRQYFMDMFLMILKSSILFKGKKNPFCITDFFLIDEIKSLTKNGNKSIWINIAVNIFPQG